MKSVISAFLGMLFAATQASATESMLLVGPQVIARTVVEKKIVDRDARSTIKMALETDKAGLGSMECDRNLGIDICHISVFIKDDETTSEAEETSYRLDVSLREGKVLAATWSLVAG